MFDIAWGEFVVIAVVALIVIGPKELPGVLRAIGQWTTKIRRMAAEFQGQFQEALREAEMADLKKEVDNLSDTAKGLTAKLEDGLNFEEATRWEPRPDAGKPADSAQPSEASPPTPSESPPVTPDNRSAEATTPPAPAHAETEAIGASPVTADTSSAPAAPSPAVDAGGQKGGEGGVHP